MKRRWLLESLGVSLLLLGPFFFPLIFAGNVTLYHHRLQFGHLIGGVLLDIAASALLGTATLAGLSRLPAQPKKIAAAIFAGIGTWLFLDCVFSLIALGINNQKEDLTSGPMKIPYWYNFVVTWYLRREALLVILPLFLLLLAFVTVESFGSMVKAVRVLMAASAFNAVWMIPQLLYIAYGVHSVGSFDYVSTRPNHEMKRRLILVIFDELSYDLVFDHPEKGRSFQNFQELRSQSVSLGDITPMGTSTDRLIPSLLTGHPIYRIRSSLNGRLWYKEGPELHWVPFDANETVFRVARDQGLSSGVVGWFNPYCRILKPVLTACYWAQGIQQEMPIEGLGASAEKSVIQNALVVPDAMISGRSLRPGAPVGAQMLRQNIADYRTLMVQGQKMIENPGIDFVLLHLPLPHPPGFFDSRTHQLCTCGNYLDNLVLADETLGVIIKQINATPWAGETTLIVSSDHSWRVPIWRGTPGWTPEEESVTRGREPDMRPVFLVHFPGQNSGVNLDGPVPEYVEHDVIASLLKGEIASPEALDSYLHQVARTSFLQSGRVASPAR